MSKAAPGFEKHPNYDVSISPSDARLRVLVGDTVLATTERALTVTETRHRPVWYLPMEDVDQARLTATEHSTYCPFKGHASYWSVDGGAGNLENVIWGYEDPYLECEPLKGYVSFYTDRVTLEIDGRQEGQEGPGWTD
ncbi:MAG: DUF427 domain-containing protein [Pseudomonadota bacterium]